MKVINKIILIFIFVLLLIPIYFMVIGSFQDIQGIFVMPPNLFPKRVTLSNYSILLKENAFIWLINTLIVTVQQYFFRYWYQLQQDMLSVFTIISIRTFCGVFFLYR